MNNNKRLKSEKVQYLSWGLARAILLLTAVCFILILLAATEQTMLILCAMTSCVGLLIGLKILFDIVNLKNSSNIRDLATEEDKDQILKKRNISTDDGRGPIGGDKLKWIGLGMSILSAFSFAAFMGAYFCGILVPAEFIFLGLALAPLIVTLLIDCLLIVLPQIKRVDEIERSVKEITYRGQTLVPHDSQFIPKPEKEGQGAVVKDGQPQQDDNVIHVKYNFREVNENSWGLRRLSTKPEATPGGETYGDEEIHSFRINPIKRGGGGGTVLLPQFISRSEEQRNCIEVFIGDDGAIKFGRFVSTSPFTNALFEDAAPLPSTNVVGAGVVASGVSRL